MTLTVCIRCGAEKKGSFWKCPQCGFKPTTEEDKAKSVILSSDYQIDEDFRGKTKDELRAIARDIQSGRAPTFDEDEVREVITYIHQVESITGKDLLIGFWQTFGPLLILMIAASIVIFSFG